MKNIRTAAIAAIFLFIFLSSHPAHAVRGDEVGTSDPFAGIVLTDGFDMPWNVAWGPDNVIWLTERMGKRIVRIDPETGKQKVAAAIHEAHAEGAHEGLLGMAFGTGFQDEDGKDGEVYVCYTYRTEPENAESARHRVVRFFYNMETGTLIYPQTIIEGIPAGNDHNGGRLVMGPDGKLYLSLGDLGHNQGANMTKPNHAQRLPTKQEIEKEDWSSYVGKILRINTDGSIPDDNPEIDGVRSHILTYGHRNPQGLAFAGTNLFSCEHGPSVDDEVNLLVPGGNYGWPHVAGYRDDQSYRFVDWSKAPEKAIKSYDYRMPDTFPEGVEAHKETDWDSPNFVEPSKTFYTVPDGYNFVDERFTGGLEYIFWPTVAPSSLAYYPSDGPIPGWENSLLMTTLKTGRLYKLTLNNDGKTVQGDAVIHFDTQNRYRDLCLNPDGKTIYVITDSGGNLLADDEKPTAVSNNPGALIAFTYTPPEDEQEEQQ